MGRKIKYDPILGELKFERSRMIQEFTATAGQTDFTVTKFALDDDYGVIINDALQGAGHSRAGNTVKMPACNSGDKVLIIN